MAWERKSTEYGWRFRGDIIGFLCFETREGRRRCGGVAELGRELPRTMYPGHLDTQLCR